jgi:hypothetical protein
MARFADVEFQDPGMRVGRAQNTHVSHIWKLKVVNEVPLPGEKAQILRSFHRAAYGLIAHCAQLAFFSERACFFTRPISISRAL